MNIFSQNKYLCAQAPKKEAADIPMPEGQGFYAAFDKGPPRLAKRASIGLSCIVSFQ